MKNTSDKKIMRAIEATENWLAKTNAPSVDESYNFTIAGCERRNLNAYKEMLGVDKRKLTGWYRELYNSL